VIRFTLDGREVEAAPGESIWTVAQREGVEIPHLCHLPRPGYRPDGNCRACMVEVEGERVLAASCIRTPREGMVVRSASERAKQTRRMVFELLLADQPDARARDDTGGFARWTRHLGLEASRFAPEAEQPAPDLSHPAMAVQLDACIQCGLCERACREVQHNDVIGMARRGMEVTVSFDLRDPHGPLLQRRLRRVRAGLPDRRAAAEIRAGRDRPPRRAAREGSGQRLPLLWRRLPSRLPRARRRDRGGGGPRRAIEPRPPLRERPLRLRLPPPLGPPDAAPSSASKAPPKDPADCLDPRRARAKFREASWEEALDRAAAGLARVRDTVGPNAAGRLRFGQRLQRGAYLFQKLVRTGFGTNNVDHCTRLCHAASVAALLEGIGSGAVTAPFMAAKDAEVIVVIGARPTENHPVAATYLKDAAARGAQLVTMDPRGSALDRHAAEVVRFAPGPRRAAAQRHAQRRGGGGALRPAIRRRPHRGLRTHPRPCRRLRPRSDGSASAASPPSRSAAWRACSRGHGQR
jgi:formate dehydrogenase major subunit